MSPKTFKSAASLARRIEIIRNDGKVNLTIREGSDRRLGISVSPSEAPALALAILEAAGVKNAGDTGERAHWEDEHGHEFAVMWLAKYIAHREARESAAIKAAAEAAAALRRKQERDRAAEAEAADLADLAELESLAKLIYETRMGGHVALIGSWTKLSAQYRDAWIDAAREARARLSRP